MKKCPHCKHLTISKRKLFFFGFSGVECSNCHVNVFVSKKFSFPIACIPLLAFIIQFENVFVYKAFKEFTIIFISLLLVVSVFLYNFPKIYFSESNVIKR
jgi:hypothetical protein